MLYSLSTEDLNNPIFQDNLKRAATYIDDLRKRADIDEYRRTELRFIEVLSSVISRREGQLASIIFSTISNFRLDYTLLDLVQLDKLQEIEQSIIAQTPLDARIALSEVITLYRLRYQNDGHFDNIVRMMSERVNQDSLSTSAYNTIIKRSSWLITLMVSIVTLNDNFRFVLTAMGLDTAVMRAM